MMHGEIQVRCPDSVLYRSQKPKSPAQAGFLLSGGERGIRTLDGLLTHTPLAGERLQPLGHLSKGAKDTGGSGLRKQLSVVIRER